METKETIVWVSALSGMAGVLISQLMTGLFGYISDRRKQNHERQALYRGKMVETGENFYFMSGELMAMIKKNIAYWKNRLDHRSEGSLAFMKLEMERLDAYQSRLQQENWKYNLVGIYYDIPYDFAAMLEDNRRSHELYLEVLDLSELFRSTLPQEREDLLADYDKTLAELCSHYQRIYDRMQGNMAAVSAALRGDFRPSP
ncbi:hypothetical protein FFF34_002865 [Inquilinus sp. KBS0705]|nr:hypothetical protein FFF34_002865 [Inquilinus sp. KBS0705]